jgi:beta-lactamase superfamily II metal-dependent hydrolase
LIKVIFKNVGQGDSIIIEWEYKSKLKVGIIDCNIYYNKNPILEYLIARSITEIEFIILTHYHIDHFSGFSEVFDYCRNNKVFIKSFYHTLTPQVLQIYNKIFTSKKVESNSSKFFDSLDSLGEILINEVPTTRHIEPLLLSENINLAFLAPDGKIYRTIAKQLSRKVNKKTFYDADINKLCTVILIECLESGILLTSDASKDIFRILKGKVPIKISLAQIPHHGSFNNYYDPFWNNLLRINNCPAIFSVGDEPKDKLPHRQTVESIDKLGYNIHSTNIVYGIKEHFFDSTSSHNDIPKIKSNYLDHFSKLTKPHYELSTMSSSLSGDQQFNFHC